MVKALVMSDFISFNGEFLEYSDVQPLYPAQPAGHIASYTRVPILANLDLDTIVYAKKKKKDASSAFEALTI